MRPMAPRAVLMVVLLSMASMSVLTGDNPLAAGFTPARAWEMGLTALAAGVGVLARLQGRNRKLPPAALVPVLILVLFSVWALFTTLWAPLILVGAGRAIQLMLTVFAVYCIASEAQPEPGRIAPNALVNSVALGLVTCVAILLAANVALFGTPFPMNSEGLDTPFSLNTRPRFFLGGSHPLKTAGFLSLTTLYAAASDLRRTGKLLLVPGLLVLLVLTDGRTALAATLVGLALRGYLHMPSSPVKVLLGLVMAVGLVGGTAIAIAFTDTNLVLSRVIGEDVFTLNGRVALWAYALDMWAEHPVVGVGYYNTRMVLLDAFPFAGHTHNSLLEIMLGTGLPGLLLALLFLGVCFHTAARTGDRLLAGVLVIVLLDGALNPVLFVPGTGQAVLLLTVMAASMMADRRTTARRGASRPLPDGPRYAPARGA
ncbi:O-antigen ligase family protein [Azospirillum sp. sgz302134]